VWRHHVESCRQFGSPGFKRPNYLPIPSANRECTLTSDAFAGALCMYSTTICNQGEVYKTRGNTVRMVGNYLGQTPKSRKEYREGTRPDYRTGCIRYFTWQFNQSFIQRSTDSFNILWQLKAGLLPSPADGKNRIKKGSSRESTSARDQCQSKRE
jgi:hypothetical protein